MLRKLGIKALCARGPAPTVDFLNLVALLIVIFRNAIGGDFAEALGPETCREDKGRKKTLSG